MYDIELIMQKQVNIAFLGNQIAYGGGATSFYLLVKSICDSRFKKFVYASTIHSQEMKRKFFKHCEKVESIDIKEVKSSQTSLTSWSKYITAKLQAKNNALELINRIENDGASILHVNNSVFSHLYKYIKENSNIKIITHIRELITSNENSKVAKKIIKNIYTYSDAIIAISNNEVVPFHNFKELHIVPNPFDFSKTKNIMNNFREKYNIDDNVVLIGMMSRFNRSKGHLLFLESLKEIKKSNLTEKSFKFILIGITKPTPVLKKILRRILLKNSYREEVLSYIDKNDLINDVILIPFTKSIFQILKALDIIVRPSLYCDPWGRDLIESMAFKKPIVATGNSEFYIENNVNGYLVNKSSSLLADKISLLINKENIRSDFGTRGYYKIKKMCDISNYGTKIEKVYHKLIYE